MTTSALSALIAALDYTMAELSCQRWVLWIWLCFVTSGSLREPFGLTKQQPFVTLKMCSFNAYPLPIGSVVGILNEQDCKKLPRRDEYDRIAVS
jgi:hypothetical protein